MTIEGRHATGRLGDERIHAELHVGQNKVANSKARFNVLVAGRRWGKTRLGVWLSLRQAVSLQAKRTWWVAPTYGIADIGWRELKRMTRNFEHEIQKADRRIVFSNGSSVRIRSAHDPDNLRGEGLDFVTLDECAFMPEAVWSEVLRPALSDRQGGALFISTPNGRNWFWRLWLRGTAGDDPLWQAWRFPTADNPNIKAAEIEQARAELPAAIFAQEYEAAFGESAGAVFRRVRQAVYGPLDSFQPQAGGSYYMGVDWGQMNDFTALVVIDGDTGCVVDVDRFNRLGWEVQRAKLRGMADKWRARSIIAESNSIGSPNIEALQAEGLPVRGFVTTAQSKPKLVQALALAFERGDIAIPYEAALVSELEAFVGERLPSGGWRYAGPSGLHDDMVIALALAWEARATGGPFSLGNL